MLFDCISLSFAAFFHESTIPANKRNSDIYRFAHELSLARSYFRFPIIDIGIHETNFDLDALLPLIAQAKRAGYISRILTDGKHFSDSTDSIRQIQELVKTGATRILLRLDHKLAAELPDKNLTNYAEACASNGLMSEVRFDYESTLPETFFDVIKKVEGVRFYVKVYPAKLRRVQRSPLDANIKQSALNHRIAISSFGEIVIRCHAQDETHEVLLGNLFTGIPLSQCIRPDRL